MRRTARFRRFSWRLLPLALAGLLAVLAALQYSWLGQLSDAERERLRSSLEARASQFTTDLDREVSRAYLLFQADSDALERRDWSGFAARWDRWNATAMHPRLVSGVYLAEPAAAPDAAGTSHSTTPPAPAAAATPSLPALSRFDPSARTFVPVDWPDDLVPLGREIAGGPQGERAGMIGTWTPAGAAVPALVAPTVGVRLLRGDTGAIIGSTAPGRRGHMIIRFDAAYARDVLLPALARRYFATGGVFDYHVSVATRARSARALYRSDAVAAAVPATAPDLTRPLFEVRPAELEALGVEGPAEREPGADTARHERVVVRLFRVRPGGAPVLEGGLWELSLWHRAGSLEAAVTSARRRNLALSSAILLLLGVALVLVVVSSERARRLAAQQMEFVAGVSHELRTPLSVIRSAGENLADGVVDDGGQVKQYGALIAAEGRKLTEMVEQVMAFAGLEAGRELRRQAVSAAAIVDRALEGCRELAEAPELRVERQVDEHLPALVGDEAALSRAVGNLVSNAVRHGATGGFVRIVVWAGLENGRPAVRIAVEDGGPGVEPGERERIFEPFYRGRPALDGQVHGNGLGLSLVRRVAEAHGGRVTVEDAPSGGARFTLHLPAAAPRRSDTPDAPDAGHAPS